MAGTKLRHLTASNPIELEGLIEALQFKVEIKNVIYVGGKWYCWFTLLEKDTLVRDVFPGNEDKTPQATKTRRKKG